MRHKITFGLFFLVSLAFGEGMYSSMPTVVLKSDLIVHGTIVRSDYNFFRVKIIDLIKDENYGLKPGDYLKIENFHTGECGFTFDINQHKEVILFLKKESDRWTVFEESGHIIDILPGYIPFYWMDSTYTLSYDRIELYLKEFLHQFPQEDYIKYEYHEFNGQTRNHPNPLIRDYLHSQGSCIYPPLDPSVVSNQNGNGVQNQKEEFPIYTIVEVMPTFPGGEKEFYKYFEDNIDYSALPEFEYIEGKVYVGVVVEKDGSLSNIKLLRGIDPAIDQYVLDLVKEMPSFIPGKQRGKATRCEYRFPVRISAH